MVQLVDQHGRELRTDSAVGGWRDRPQYVNSYRNHLRARYDAARTTDDNERHWANADYLSANAAANSAVRRKLRARARYEAQENNSYAKGMILTLANDLIGTGPKLQLMVKQRELSRRIETSFRRWAEEIRLAEKLRTMRVAKVVDGESFALLTTNPKLRHEVKLDLSPIEADYISSPDETFLDERKEVDGIRFDQYGNPSTYHVLDYHPGSFRAFGTTQGAWINQSRVVHVYRVDRPGQKHGVTELVTALPLFAMLRRFTLATIAAAETAADFAAVMRTQSSPTVEAAELAEDEWFDAIPLEYRAMLTLPHGWDITQLKPEHPTTTYQMFKREIINEIARCLNMPFNVAAANSSEYNYASGRMDHQVYHKSIGVERHYWECTVLSKVFLAWLDEALFAAPELVAGLPPFSQLHWSWFWDSFGHVDPQKEANAQRTRLGNGTTTPQEETAKEGRDFEELAVEAAANFGVSVSEYKQALFGQIMGAVKESNEQTSETDEATEDGEVATDSSQPEDA